MTGNNAKVLLTTGLASDALSSEVTQSKMPCEYRMRGNNPQERPLPYFLVPIS